MAWPLPRLPNPFPKPDNKPAGEGGGMPGGGDPLGALWMLAQNPTHVSVRPPAQGFGSAYQMARAPQQQEHQQVNFDQAPATPVSDTANPFTSLDKTLRQEAFAKRFPWAAT